MKPGSIRHRVTARIFQWLGLYQPKPHLDVDGTPLTYKQLKGEVDALLAKYATPDSQSAEKRFKERMDAINKGQL